MRNRYVAVGIFVTVGLAVFAAAIFLIGNQNSVFGKHVKLFTEVKNLNGLSKGATIRVGGFDAGEVTAIDVPSSPSSGFRLTLQISDKVKGLVRSDSVATIATDGVVGDKVLLIGPGSPAAPEAPPSSVLPSKETSDISDLIQKSTTLVTDASATMKVVADRLTTTLNSVNTTVNDTDEVVAGIKQGRGTVGMLLRDEQTAAEIKQAVANVRDATVSLNHASAQADALVSDFKSRNLGEKADSIISDIQSRHFGQKIDRTLDSVHSAAENMDATTREVRATVAKAFAPDAQGRDIADNVRDTLENVNEATGNLNDDSEALKHGFLFRGYFKKRGYYSMDRIEPAKYRKDKVFTNPKNPRVWIDAAGLFESKDKESEQLSPEGKLRIDAAIADLGDRAINGGIVIEGYADSGQPAEQLTMSRTRAILVRNYLHGRFQLDNQNLGAVPLRGLPPPSTHKSNWNGICIVLLSRAS